MSIAPLSTPAIPIVVDLQSPNFGAIDATDTALQEHSVSEKPALSLALEFFNPSIKLCTDSGTQKRFRERIPNTVSADGGLAIPTLYRKVLSR